MRSRARTGVPVDGWAGRAWIKADDDDGTPDDALQNHVGIPIFSERLRRALERAKIGDA